MFNVGESIHVYGGRRNAYVIQDIYQNPRHPGYFVQFENGSRGLFFHKDCQLAYANEGPEEYEGWFK